MARAGDIQYFNRLLMLSDIDIEPSCDDVYKKSILKTVNELKNRSVNIFKS